MSRFFASLGIAAVLLGSLMAAAPMAQARGHDSNTLHRLGNAIQYPIRKASENTSIAAHRTVGMKSMVHRRNGNKTYRSVVTRNGRIHRLHRVGYRR